MRDVFVCVGKIMKAARTRGARLFARRLRYSALLVGGWVGLLVGPSIAASSDVHRFGIGGTAILCPPSSELDPLVLRYGKESTNLVVGSGHTPGFSFLFKASSVQSDIPSGVFKVIPELESIAYVNTLSGTVGFLSRADSLRLGPAMRARDLADEWGQTGPCANVYVAPVGRGKVFEVKCSAKDNYSNILNVVPDRSRPMPGLNYIMVASCNDKRIPFGPFAGAELHTCRRVLVERGFILDYQIQKDNIPLYPQIDAFLERKVEQWRENCSK